MKKTLFLVLFFIPLLIFAQVDSSKFKTFGIVLKGKDVDVIATFVKADPGNFPDLDSLIKLKYRNAPGNATDVTFDSIPNRQWLKIAFKAKLDNVCLLEGVFKNIDTEFRLHAGSWIIWRLDKDKVITDKAYDDKKKQGQRYGQKKDDEDL